MFQLNIDVTLQICLSEHSTEDLIQFSTLNTLKVAFKNVRKMTGSEVRSCKS